MKMEIIKNDTDLGNTILRKKSEDILDIDKSIKNLIKKMKSTLNKSGGVGLAAPQVGINKNLILVKPENKIYVFINPVITYFSSEKDVEEEGCLSVPHVFLKIDRSKSISLQSKDEKGNDLDLNIEGYLARIIQHEVDHLLGKLIVDY
ncbi:peptide deformylase [Patescibacteria group bacterium]|nr:peptide deformylase [Patescibacteria group bacterium]